MVWFKVDDTLAAHPKARRAGLAAMGLWTVAGAWSAQQLTDGFVPAWYVETWPAGKKLASTLVTAGLWSAETCDGEKGWRFHQWTDRNPTRQQVEDDREAAKKRMQEARDKRKAEREAERSRSEEVRANVPPNVPENERRISVERSPTPTRPEGTGRYAPVLTDGDHHPTDLASSDAHEHEPPDEQTERTPAQRLVARYAAGVRLSDPGQAMRTVSDALAEGVPERLIAGGIGVLIAEQSSCTRGRLRVALLKAEGNWGPVAGVTKPGNPYLDDLRAAAAEAGDSDAPLLWAVPDPPALEAR